MMQKRTTYLRFGQLRQERGEKHVRQGELVQAENVCQTDKAGVYQKRKGFSMTTMTFSGATWGSATVSSCVPAKDMAGSLMRDSQDRAWARDTTNNVWNYRGTHPRTWVDTQVVNSTNYVDPRPVRLEVGANIWAFAIAYAPGSLAKSYDITIYDKVSGKVSSTTKVNAYIGGNQIAAMSAVYDGTDVWLFWATGADAAVKSHRFASAAVTTTPTEATFYTAGGNIQTVASCYSATAGVTLVAFGGNSGGKQRLYHSQLDTTNGQAKASPATAKVLDDTTALPINALGFHANQRTAASIMYYHYDGFQIGGSGATYSGPVTVTVTISTLAATVYNHHVNGSATAADAVVAAGIAGIPVGGGDTGEVVFWSKNNCMSRMTCTISGGTSGTTDQDYYWAGWWIASGLAVIGNYLYFLTAYDDIASSCMPIVGGSAVQTVTHQRSFHVRRMLCADIKANAALGTPSYTWSWNIVGHCLNGSAPAIFQGATTTVATAGGFATVGAPPAASASGNKIITAVAADIGVTGSVGIVRIEVDTAKSWGKECSFSGRAYSPGSIPVCWSQNDNVHEISPLLAPSWIYVQGAGTGSDFATAACVYVIRDSDGTSYRSSPYVLRTTIGHGATLWFPLLRHCLSGTTVSIEIYLGTDAKPKLQTILPNEINNAFGSGGQNYCTYTTPTAATMVNGEVLYAVGNALTQAWPPQCQAVGSWRQRLFLAQKNTIWASHEESAQRGPLFNEVMTSTWGESQTDINAMGAVDYNYFALVGANGASVIDGPGPDQLGSGNYVAKTLKTGAGMTIGAPCLSSDMGLYFQDRNTGRLMCITQALQVSECAGGAYDYSANTIAAINHSEAERQIHFHTSTTIAGTTKGTVIVVDYQHKTDTAPFGQVYIWPYIPVIAYAASEDTSGVFYLGSGGTLHRRSSNYFDTKVDTLPASYAMLIKTAPVQLSDLQGEFDVSKVEVLLKYKASGALNIDVYPNYSSSITRSGIINVSSSVAQAMTRPANCMRIQSIAVSVYEYSSTTDSFEIEGFAIEWLPRGHIKQLNTSQVV